MTATDIHHKNLKWLNDFIRFLPLKSQFVFSGNIRDIQLSNKNDKNIFRSLASTLNIELRSSGYSNVLCYDFINGFKGVDVSSQSDLSSTDELMRQLGLNPINGTASVSLEGFEEVLDKLVKWENGPVALIIDYASRLILQQNNFSQREHSLFTRALIRSHEGRSRAFGQPPKPFFNTIIWLVEKESDLPDWLLLDNHKIRHISIPTPDYRTRYIFANSLVPALDGISDASQELKNTTVENFADSTEGLLLVDLMLIAQLCRDEKLGYSKIGEAVRRYKVGVSEDPWQKIDRKKISDGENFISKRVKGQVHAVTHILDIIKRAITGVGTPRRGGRPRGVVFLAGPTGVGKTELAKSITSLLFGDEGAYIRFDMSEFSAEHSDQRLIGAPPGYVGYDVGGELTNAIREKPFSVVLFDEIEKAHPKILDKFLQILDDGVLTSGRGERVYFTESFIVFTSNLGIYKTDSLGIRTATVTPNDSFELIQQRVRTEIENYFKLHLNRPEILNRIGENIIVFDFIRAEVAEQIFNNMVQGVLSDLNESQGINFILDPSVLIMLKDFSLADLSNGGRGIRNKIETHLVNPLARELFDQNIQSACEFIVSDICIGPVTTLKIAPANRQENSI
ncbi:TPA: ATP-dependent Clp protease ATP-binding subunit [Legionella pneumophila]|nr:ATP-dependent Clp protease ATP-binding subunit [Legionella pneumophila]